MKFTNSASGAPSPAGAYSQAVEACGLIFCAGQVGLDPDTNTLVDGGVEAEAAQVLKNLGAVLEAAGSSPRHLVMTTIFLANVSDFSVVNKLYGEFVDGESPPARQTVAVKDLPLGAQVEISVIAAPA